MVIPNKDRNIGLDIARTFAMLLVLFAHTIWIGDNYPKTVSILMQLSGTIGVEVFFIISGFLIAKILLRDINSENYSFKSVRRFLARRWIRTFPNYYFILIINIIIWYFIYNQLPNYFYKYFIYLQNFFSPSPPFYRISWSLSVEQFSYVIVPVALYFVLFVFKNGNRSRLFLYTTLLAVLLFTVPKVIFYFNNELSDIVDWNENIRKVLINRLDAVYIGFLFRYIYDKKKEWFTINKYILFFLGIAIILILHVFRSVLGINVEQTPFFMIVLYLPLNAISICLLLPYFMEVKIKSKFLSYFFIRFSLLSYSIYLLHYSIVLHVLKVIFPSESLVGFQLWAYTFLYWGITFLLSYLLYRFFEKPATNLRDNPRIKRFLKID